MPRPPESAHPSIDLSLTQVVAASAGAVVATAIAGVMRLAGTLLGAVLVTVVATIATAVVSLWLRRSRQRILTVRASADASAPADVATDEADAGDVDGAAGPDRGAPTRVDPPAALELPIPRSPRSRPVLAGLIGGIVAATLLAATGNPVLSLRVDASAVDELQRWLTNAAQHVESWAAALG